MFVYLDDRIYSLLLIRGLRHKATLYNNWRLSLGDRRKCRLYPLIVDNYLQPSTIWQIIVLWDGVWKKRHC